MTDGGKGGRPAALFLRYVSDAQPGIRRVRCGPRFRYLADDGKPLRDPVQLARIRSLAIPPAYENVWICNDPDGHIQATARDARGRKQYRYHPAWREVRDATKFERMGAFGRALPGIRAAIERDLARPGLCRERIVATIVQLLERTLVRVGNEEYARANGSYGLTTLREDHVRVVEREAVRFRFRGKSGVVHDVTVEDRRVARVVQRCLDIPGQELFRYLDENGDARPVGSSDVNAYLRDLAGTDYSAKDFRTWSGSVLALESLQRRPWRSATEAKREVAAMAREVAQRLGNTPAVCRKAYIHPTVIDAYLEGGPEALRVAPLRKTPEGLSAAEAQLLALLDRRRRKRRATRRAAVGTSQRSLPRQRPRQVPSRPAMEP